MFLSESKRLSRIKEQLDGWNAITDLLSSEYSKASKTQNLQNLLQMCSGVEIDQRAISANLSRSLKSICGKHNILLEDIPTQLKPAYHYAKGKQQEYGIRFQNVEYRYRRIKIVQRVTTIAATIVTSVAVIAIIYKPIVYTMANIAEKEENYTEAINIYVELGDYKDSEEKIAALTDTLKMQAAYDSAMQKYNDDDYYNAYREFDVLDYKDSQAMANKAKSAFMNSKYENALKLVESGNYEDAAEVFLTMGDYRDSTEQYTEAIILCAEKLKREGNLEIAYQLLKEIDGNDKAESERLKIANDFYALACDNIEKQDFLTAYNQLRLIENDINIDETIKTLKPRMLELAKETLELPRMENESKAVAIKYYLELYSEDEEALNLMETADNLKVVRVIEDENTNESHTEWFRAGDMARIREEYEKEGKKFK